MLEVSHEVMITSVKSSQPLTHTLTRTPSQLNISCTNEYASQASQSSIEQNLLENNELKEEVERLRRDVIQLKGKEKAQPSQDNRDNIVNKLEKGSNLASSKAQQKNHISSKANTTKSKKHGKGYAMVVDCMDMSGLCIHTRVGLTRLKPQIKRLLPRNAQCTKRQERKPKLQHEDAMDAMRWAIRLIDVHTSKTSIEQTKAAYAMLVREMGI